MPSIGCLIIKLRSWPCFVSHMDGVGRAMTMMKLEAEAPVQIIRGRFGPSGGIVPELVKTDK